MATRRQGIENVDEDETWFEDAAVNRSGGRLNVWLGLGIVAVVAVGFALGAFANPPATANASLDAMRARARAAEGTRPLAGALLLERLDRAQATGGLKIAAAEPEKPAEIVPEPEKPAEVVPEPEKPAEVTPEPAKPARPVKPAEANTRPVEKPEVVKPVEPAQPEPVPTSTIEQALLDGKKHLDARRWAEAKTAFERALAAAPGNTRALFGRGRALFEQRQTTAAMKDFEAVLAAEPSHPNALLMAGSAAQELGRKDDARKFYERYLEAWPTGRRASEIKLLLERL